MLFWIINSAWCLLNTTAELPSKYCRYFPVNKPVNPQHGMSNGWFKDCVQQVPEPDNSCEKSAETIPQVFFFYKQTERWIKHENVHAWLVSSHNVLIFFMGLCLNSNHVCSPGLLISMALLFWASISTNSIHMKYKGRCLMPRMETIWARTFFYSHHTTCSVGVGLSRTPITQTWVHSACDALVSHLDSLLLWQSCTNWGNAIKSKQGNQEPSSINVNMALFFTWQSIVL